MDVFSIVVVGVSLASVILSVWGVVRSRPHKEAAVSAMREALRAAEQLSLAYERFDQKLVEEQRATAIERAQRLWSPPQVFVTHANYAVFEMVHDSWGQKASLASTVAGWDRPSPSSAQKDSLFVYGVQDFDDLLIEDVSARAVSVQRALGKVASSRDHHDTGNLALA